MSGLAVALPPAAAPAETEAARKALATLQAQAALLGVELVLMADNTLLAHRGGWFRPLADLDAARAWLAQVTGRVDVHQVG